MSAPTGTLEIARGGTRETFSWNGDVEDRAAAKAAFDAALAGGGVMAVVHDAPGKSHQVRDFTEVEKVERETGVVSAEITTALVGG